MAGRIIIIGGVGAGAGAATRARRLDEQADITIFERSGYVSFANCGLPYYIGKVITERQKLIVQTPEQFKERFNIDVRVLHEVMSIDRANKTIMVRNLESGEETQESYDKLILTPGADPVIPPIENMELPNVFRLRNIEDTDAVYDYLENKNIRKAAIIGAGFIGLEVAEGLVHRGIETHVVELLDQVMAPLDKDMARFVEEHLVDKETRLHLNNGLKELHAESGLVTQVILNDDTRIDADLVLMSIGVRPNTRLAREAGLEIGERGGIQVNDFMQTTDADIFAAGDAVEIPHGVTGEQTLIPLAGPANKHGRLAGEIAVTHEPQKASKALGTAIVKIFDLTVASTGLSAKAAQNAGIEWRYVYVKRANHASYYPGAEDLHVKLIYSSDDGRVLGAQIIGKSGVDRRIDVIATLIHMNGTIDDLAELDLAYAPPYGSAKDPVNIAAYVAQNQERGMVQNIHPEEVEEYLAQGYQLIDARTPKEFEGGTIPGARNIPLDDLRQRAAEIAQDKPVLIFCQIGLRGYLAARILMGQGREDIVNLAGGYSWWSVQQ